MVNQAREAAGPPKPIDAARHRHSHAQYPISGKNLPRLKAPYAQDKTPRKLVGRNVGHHRGGTARPVWRHSVAHPAPPRRSLATLVSLFYEFRLRPRSFSLLSSNCSDRSLCDLVIRRHRCRAISRRRVRQPHPLRAIAGVRRCPSSPVASLQRSSGTARLAEG